MVAGAALAVDYILTVAVSISSGVEQITSAFASLKAHSVAIAVALVIIIMIGNLRGIRESSKMFGLPAYAFIIGILALIIGGAVKLMSGYDPPAPELAKPLQSITLLLMLKAFASGCTALTGVEAVSNAVPNFKKPSTKYAKTVLLLLSIIILVLFGGTSVIATYYHVVPERERRAADPYCQRDLRAWVYVLLYYRDYLHHPDPGGQYRVFRIPDG